MDNKPRTNSELIIDILRSGRTLTLSEITATLSEISGKKVKMTDISSQLSKLSNKNKTEIGFLIRRKKSDDGTFAYSLVKESLEMIPEEMYDLTRRTGKMRHTLEKALEKYPALKKYVGDAVIKPAKPAKTAKPKKVREAAPVVEPEGQVQPDTADIMNLLRKLIDGGLKIDVNVKIRFAGTLE